MAIQRLPSRSAHSIASRLVRSPLFAQKHRTFCVGSTVLSGRGGPANVSQPTRSLIETCSDLWDSPAPSWAQVKVTGRVMAKETGMGLVL